MMNILPLESVDALRVLRRKAAWIDEHRIARESVPIGHAPLDAVMGGGLMRGRLHELFAADPTDNGSAAGFTAMLACRVSQPGAPLFWLREETVERQGHLHAPGLAEIGIDPARLVMIILPDPVALLRAAVDVVRCTSIGAAVIELWRNPRALDLTASRRLALAAETSGVTPLLLRADAQPGPSAAQTRWSIHAAPSPALEAEAPGGPAFFVELLRQRGRPAGGGWHLEWDRDRGCFREPSLSGAVVSDDVGRSLDSEARRYAG